MREHDDALTKEWVGIRCKSFPVQRCRKQAYNQRVALLCAAVVQGGTGWRRRQHVDSLVSTLHSTHSMHVFLTS